MSESDGVSEKEFETLRYEKPAERVARIVLDRPDARNAQNKAMTYELNALLSHAELTLSCRK